MEIWRLDLLEDKKLKGILSFKSSRSTEFVKPGYLCGAFSAYVSQPSFTATTPILSAHISLTRSITDDFLGISYHSLFI